MAATRSRSVVVIRAVQRKSERNKRSLVQPSPRAPSSRRAEALTHSSRQSNAEKNKCLSAVSGKLTKYSYRGLCGLGGETALARWFELDPSALTLSYWSLNHVSGTPRKVFRLDRLVEVDTNPYHHFINLRFCDHHKTLQLKAETQEDFQRWMAVFANYEVVSESEASRDWDASPTNDF